MVKHVVFALIAAMRFRSSGQIPDVPLNHHLRLFGPFFHLIPESYSQGACPYMALAAYAAAKLACLVKIFLFSYA
jgi:hypothetical protein